MRTRGLQAYLAAGVCLLSMAGGAVYAQDSISTNIDLAYVSKYVWRGTVPNSDPAFQPSVTISHPSGASFNFWGSMDTTGINDNSGNFTEQDYTLSYAWKSMSAGYIYYAFPNTAYPSTQEMFFNIPLVSKLPVSLALNYDFDEAKGLYGALSTSYAYAMKSGKAMSLSAKLGFASSGYNDFYFGADKTGLVDLVLGVSMPFESGKMKITPSLTYSTMVNSDLKDALSANGVDENNFIAGLTISSAF
ncbi:MAG: TorF family putative porin [Armatimonadota bacterium]